MNAKERLAILKELNNDKDRVHCPLEEVRRADEYLKAEWGIRHFASAEQWTEEYRGRVPKQTLLQFEDYQQRLELQRNFKNKHLSDYRSRNALQVSYIGGTPFDGSVETLKYDLLAENSFHDLWFSLRRVYALDVLAHLRSLIEHLQVTGPILDVGCNAGHMAIWLARETGLHVVGVDASQKSLAVATERSQGMGTVRFRAMDYAKEDFDQSYDLIYCSSGFPDEQNEAAVLENIAQALEPGGICVLVGTIGNDWRHEILRDVAMENQLGFGMVDTVGNWSFADAEYEWRDVVVLVKNVQSPLPQKIWPDQVYCAGFSEYIAAATTPPEEKTIAYFRAKKVAGLLGLAPGKTRSLSGKAGVSRKLRAKPAAKSASRTGTKKKQ